MKSGQPEHLVLSSREVDLNLVESAFPEYLKLRSICWLLRIGAASTEGVVLARASSNAVRTAVEYARSRGWSQFMVRHDRPRGRPRTTQGGFLIRTDEVQKWVEVFSDDGICMLLEPLNPLRNGYNLSCLLESTSATVEILGPGFDASDLQRGQTQPHEVCTLDVESHRFRRSRLCSEESYLASLMEREQKIWWKYAQRELLQKHWRMLTSAEHDECLRFIVSARGEPIPKSYVPMGSKIRFQYLKSALPVLTQWYVERRLLPAVVAGSFVQDGTFRFWDVNTSERWLP